jgi:hypothetical protein
MLHKHASQAAADAALLLRCSALLWLLLLQTIAGGIAKTATFAAYPALFLFGELHCHCLVKCAVSRFANSASVLGCMTGGSVQRAAGTEMCPQKAHVLTAWWHGYSAPLAAGQASL